MSQTEISVARNSGAGQGTYEPQVDITDPPSLILVVKSRLERFEKELKATGGSKGLSNAQNVIIGELIGDVTTICGIEERKYGHQQGELEMMEKILQIREMECREEREKMLKTREQLGRTLENTKRIIEIPSLERIRNKDDEQTIMMECDTEGDVDELRELLKRKNKEGEIDRPNDIISTKDHRLILKVHDKGKAERIYKTLTEDEGIRDKAKMKLMGKKKTRIIMFGVPGDLTPEEVKQDLLNREGIEDGEIDFVRSTDGLRGNKNMVLDVDATTKAVLLMNGTICIEYTRVRVALYKRINRCFKCQAYGHVAVGCTKQTRCAGCGEDHDTRNCESATIRCVNCNSEAHRADSPQCSAFQEYKKKIFSNTRPKEAPQHLIS